MKNWILIILLVYINNFVCGCKDISNDKNKNIDKIKDLSPHLKKDFENLLGFACFSGGSKSKSVEEMTEFLKQKDFASIKTNLTSKNNSEKFLAVVLCEKFREEGKIYLSTEELTIINEIKNSSDTFEICSGCTYYEKFSLKQIFQNRGHFIWARIDSWISENYI